MCSACERNLTPGLLWPITTQFRQLAVVPHPRDAFATQGPLLNDIRHESMSPDSNPASNHLTLCAEVPCAVRFRH